MFFILFSLLLSEIYNENLIFYFTDPGHIPTLCILVSSWCPHCVQSTPVFEEIMKLYKDDERFTVMQINCDQYNSICKQFPETSTPAIYWMYSDASRAEQFHGSVTVSNIKSFIEKHLGSTFIDIHNEEEFQKELDDHNDSSIFVYQRDENNDLTKIITLIASKLSSYPCHFFFLKYKRNPERNENYLYNYNLMTKKKIEYSGNFLENDLKEFILKFAFPPISHISTLFFDNAVETSSTVLLLADEPPYYYQEKLKNMSVRFPPSLRTAIIYCGNTPKLCLNLLIQSGKGPQFLMYNPKLQYNYYYKDTFEEEGFIQWVNNVLDGKVRPVGTGAGFIGFLYNIIDNAKRNGIVSLTLTASVFVVLILTFVFGAANSYKEYQRKKLYYSKLE